MKFNTIIFVLLLGLLALTLLSSCGLTRQERRLRRDSRQIEAIRGRSPELFTNKVDTTQTQDSLDVGVTLVQDTAKIKDLLRDYVALDSAKQINHSNVSIDLEQKVLRHQLLINKQRDIERSIITAGFMKKQQSFIGKNYNLKVAFDPSSSQQIKLSGTIEHLVINNKTTITLKEYIHAKMTMKQAFIRLWPVWGTMAVLGIIGAALRIILK